MERNLCPHCGSDPVDGDECEHLIEHGDDLRTMDALHELADSDLLTEVREVDPGAIPDFASDFFDDCGPNLSVDRSAWEGGAPGLDGTYYFIWSSQPSQASADINTRLKQLLNQANRKRRKRRV